MKPKTVITILGNREINMIFLKRVIPYYDICLQINVKIFSVNM